MPRISEVSKQPMIVIAGPTATGKSSLAIDLSKIFNGYVINADSRQIYKEINIGTDKPKPDTIVDAKHITVDGIDHYLYGFLSIQERYSIAKFQSDVENVLKLNSSNGMIPILVGGTGLYIDSIVYDYQLPSEKSELPDNLDSLGINELKEKLDEGIDELNQSDRENKHRLIQAIRRGSSGDKKEKSENILYFNIDPPFEQIETRIKTRVEKMFDSGLLQENKELLDLGYSYAETPGLQTIGYKEFEEYFNDEATLDEVKELIYIHTRQYAKRQLTWFRRNKDAVKLDSLIDSFEFAVDHVGSFLRKLNSP